MLRKMESDMFISNALSPSQRQLGATPSIGQEGILSASYLSYMDDMDQYKALSQWESIAPMGPSMAKPLIKR